jgi:hypothetical protein
MQLEPWDDGAERTNGLPRVPVGLDASIQGIIVVSLGYAIP